MTYFVNTQNDFSVGKVSDTFTIHFQYFIIDQKASLGSRRVYDTSQILLLGLYLSIKIEYSTWAHADTEIHFPSSPQLDISQMFPNFSKNFQRFL